MPRYPRVDAPNSWHHVMNRGIARRTIFEGSVDIRAFLTLVALCVRARLIEVHAFCLLSTHFHLLVRSPNGHLSGAMQRIENEYVRWFNRSRRRDGPLFRSRFRSKPVDSLEYRQQVVRYIDSNAVTAGLVASPALYPHGSARWYARRSGPIWLTRSWIESVVRGRTGTPDYDPDQYAPTFGLSVPPGLARVIEKRIELSVHGADPLDDLLGAASGEVLAWMRRKAALADGTKVGLPVCDPADVLAVIADARTSRGPWRIPMSRKATDAWPQIQAALLRELCGSAWSEIGSRIGFSGPGAQQIYRRHRRCILDHDEYSSVVAELAAEALQRCHRGARAGVNP